MTTKSLNDIGNIKKKFQSLLTEKNEVEGIEHDAMILMSAYLSEIERIQKEQDIKRNKLAEMINISASYLTQVFRGTKPLNFYTIAKIKRKLNIEFTVKAHYKKKVVKEELDLKNYKIGMNQPQLAFFLLAKEAIQALATLQLEQLVHRIPQKLTNGSNFI